MQVKTEIQNLGPFARLEELKRIFDLAYLDLCDEVGRLRADLEWQSKTALDIVREQSQSDLISQKETAKMVKVSPSAFTREPEHLACLIRTRVRIGRRCYFPRVAVLAHNKNMMAKSKCGTCDKTVKGEVSNLRVVKGK